MESIYPQSLFSEAKSEVNPEAGKVSSDFGFLRPLKATIVFETYWRFAVERQAIFFRRIKTPVGPWTVDPILKEYKFTNAYRASDRVSQYLIQKVIYEGKQETEEVFFRILLFKIFNRIDTWTLLKATLGELSWRKFDFDAYDAVLSHALNEGKRIYSPAYIMPSGGPGSRFPRKHQMHLSLLQRMLKEGLPSSIHKAGSMAKAFELIKNYPTIGDFLAYQYVTDINYSELTDFEEMSFVMPGPGALSGIRKCFSDFGGMSETEIIGLVAQYQKECFSSLGIEFSSLWGRPLQLIDCQNLFCEVDKYSRVRHPTVLGNMDRVRIKQKFRQTNGQIDYFFPPKWRLNTKAVVEVPDV
jgi:hypothetical protein